MVAKKTGSGYTVHHMNYIDRSFQSLCEAIRHFSKDSENIFLPMKPTYAYDMILVTNENSKECIVRIKVIQTESQAPSGTYIVNIRKSGGYLNSKEHHSPFDPSMCDVVFVISPEGTYKIPSSKITQKRAISLSMFEVYKCSELAQR